MDVRLFGVPGVRVEADHVAGPHRPLVGGVEDADDGQPLCPRAGERHLQLVADLQATGVGHRLRHDDPAGGAPIDYLQPYLAAAGHVVVMAADGSTFAHEHAEATDAQGRPVFALQGQTCGPRLDFHTGFPRPGRYRLWGQFELASGTVGTVPFTVTAS